MARSKKLNSDQLARVRELAARRAAETENEVSAEAKTVDSAIEQAAEVRPSLLPAIDNEIFRKLGTCGAVESSLQNADFTVPVSRQYVDGSFPAGEILEYAGGEWRSTSEEKRAIERELTVQYDHYRKSALVHKQTRRYMHGIIRPGMTTLEIAQKLEAKSRELISAIGLEAGWAFPTGLSLNSCAAHYTPNYGEPPVVLQYDDIMKVDFGVHVAGHLVDSAWTVSFNPQWDPLVEATKEATNAGIKAAGIDMQLGELGGIIEEVIESYEVERERGRPLVPVRAVSNLSGHSVEPYRIHAGKSVPIVACEDRSRMEEGEVYAIETFATTGTGRVKEAGECSHYMQNYDFAHNQGQRRALHNESARPLLKLIQRNHSTLAFCRRWLDDAGAKKHLLPLRTLERAGIVDAYPPLCDKEGSLTSQWEHTILLRPTCKEVISRADDY